MKFDVVNPFAQPIGLQMTQRFEHHLAWPMETGSDIALERNCVTSGVTVNFAVVWTKEMLAKYYTPSESHLKGTLRHEVKNKMFQFHYLGQTAIFLFS